ncbi:MAG TPA: 2-amino-4-hydroxy-6-hydroxymethyldihydropteridine diphosphokinase [Caldilineae bacterium]|nr:2-amino-4-hydroxy-6-hydroxymethyldihydropteridine diphosphokinase [Caldilineae bacterium]HIQ11378.1 2-amino-4-hydroxy-6-hydroxymethyldihydropteridine diphosphokinase [Caldilineales bacterium]
MPAILLALGTNLGDRVANLARARDLLEQNVLRIQAVSPIYETEPWGVLDQPRFLNQILSGVTDLEPEALLDRVKDIERAMGRIFGGVRYGPRIIDIDILAYDDLVFRSPRLTIPHARLPERAFVLVPLADIAPDWRHPLLGLSIVEMLAKLDASGVFPYGR